MASQIDQQQVKHVAELAKLEFNDAELAKFTPQLGRILMAWNQCIRQRIASTLCVKTLQSRATSEKPCLKMLPTRKAA